MLVIAQKLFQVWQYCGLATKHRGSLKGGDQGLMRQPSIASKSETLQIGLLSIAFKSGNSCGLDLDIAEQLEEIYREENRLFN